MIRWVPTARSVGVEAVTVPASTPTDLAVGTHRITARYSGDGTIAASTSAAGTLVVGKASTTAAVQVRKGAKRTRLTVSVSDLANGESVTGKVRIVVGGKVFKTVALRSKHDGTRTVVLKGTFPATARVRVKFLGSAVVSAATSKAVPLNGKR